MTNITWCGQNDYENYIKSKIQRTKVVLEINCGIELQTFFEPELLHICCEARPEAVHVLQNPLFGHRKIMVVPGRGHDLLTIMPDKSVDTIFIHQTTQTPDEDLALLAQCERVARAQVVVLKKLDKDDSCDTDSAGWRAEDFDPSWEAIAVRESAAEAASPRAFCALKNIPIPPRRDLKKKLALVSHDVPPSDSGQAIMLHRFFKDVNEDHYCLISSHDHHARIFPKNLLPNTTDGLPARFYFIGSQPFRLYWKLMRLSPLLRRVWELSRTVSETIRRSRKIARIVRQERCQAILGCSGNIIDFPAAYFASKLARVPFYAYLFDYYSYQAIAPAYRLFTRFAEKVAVQGAAAVIVPNEYLANEYQRRYGVTCVVIHNPLEPDEANENVVAPSGEETRILYTGQVYDAHYDAFVDLVQALALLNDPTIKLHIYTAQPPEILQAAGIRGAVVFHAHQPHSKIRLLQRQADILFLPLAFNSGYPEIIKTSAPSKLGEYLASGQPILGHVPQDSFVSWYLNTYQCGLVVDKKDPRLLLEAIQRLRSDIPLREALVKNARQRAGIDFDLQAARNTLFDLTEGAK